MYTDFVGANQLEKRPELGMINEIAPIDESRSLNRSEKPGGSQFQELLGKPGW